MQVAKLKSMEIVGPDFLRHDGESNRSQAAEDSGDLEFLYRESENSCFWILSVRSHFVLVGSIAKFEMKGGEIQDEMKMPRQVG
jgi:hypothetical protein